MSWESDMSDNREVPSLYQRCDHPRSQLRRQVRCNGFIRYVTQCLECGDSVKAVARAQLVDVSRIPDFDKGIKVAYRERVSRECEERRAQQDRVREEESRRWWAWYNEYLRSPEWRHRRALVMDRADGLCEGCRINRANHAHHTTYDHAGEEFLWELVAICKPCHDRVHGHETGRDD
jgi:5-methylcytosine-specific restriction endonuclease McrA